METCIFCKIVKEEIPCDKVFEDDTILAFKDISPVAPTHIVIIPKKHINSLNDLSHEDSETISHIFSTIKLIAEKAGICESGYRVVSNCGTDGGQTVPHVHFHLLGGRELKWPPG